MTDTVTTLKPAKTRVHILLPQSTHDDLKNASAVLGESIATITDKAIAAYLDSLALPNAESRARAARAARAAAIEGAIAARAAGHDTVNYNDLP